MKREVRRRRRGRPALDLLEAAVRLLRSAPSSALLCYYLGSVPCALGLLYFWEDMSRGAFAREYLLEASLGAAALFLWMKCWQTVFASKLRAHLLLEPEEPWTWRRLGRVVCVQAAVQPSGLFARALAAQLLLPYVWTYSFYQNVGILGDGIHAGVRPVLRAAAAQASLWPRQAHGALFCLAGFAFTIFLNLGLLLAALPFMLKMLFGVETIFTRHPEALLNSTFFATVLAGTYLCFDPLRKAVFVLRCFHGLSLQAGDDLRAELKAFRQRASAPALAATLLLGAHPLARAQTTEPPTTARVQPAQLTQSLDRVLERREFAWRLPRSTAEPAPPQQSWLTTFCKGIWKMMVGTVKSVVRWVLSVVEWLYQTFRRKPRPEARRDGGQARDWQSIARVSLIGLATGLAAILALIFWRRRRGRSAAIVAAQPTAVRPDLTQEDVTADQLPEDGWLQLARELVQRGELRLALRASYLAGLAHLHQRNLIGLATHKSNRDYDRELRRRARAETELLAAFGRNLSAFERAWYGEHPVTPDSLGRFSQDLERIRVC